MSVQYDQAEGASGPGRATSSPDAPRARRRGVFGAVVLVVAALVVAVVALGAPGGPDGPPALRVSRTAASEAGVGGMASVYLVVEDDGGPDALVGATSDAASVVTLHGTESADGGAVMVDEARMAVPGGGRLELVPGGRHLMLHHLYRELVPGDRVRVTLTFERSGPVEVDVPVLGYAQLADLVGP